MNEMDYQYHIKGVCASGVEFTIEDGVITALRFDGGCSGNTQGIARLAVGMKAGDVAEKLRGVRCGRKATSCPDQLALAVEKALQSAEEQDAGEPAQPEPAEPKPAQPKPPETGIGRTGAGPAEAGTAL